MNQHSLPGETPQPERGDAGRFKATGLGKAHWIKGGPGTMVQRTDISFMQDRSSLSSQESQLSSPESSVRQLHVFISSNTRGLPSTVYSIPSPLEGLSALKSD